MSLPLILNVLYQRRKLMSHNNWTPEKITDSQQHRLNKLRAYAYNNSDFYRKYHQGYYDKGLEDLPVVTKSMMMENFDDFVTDKRIKLNEVQSFIKNMEGAIYKNKYWITLTSGTTGTPGIFLSDFGEWSQIIASYSRGYELGGMKPSIFKKTKMAMVSTTFPLHQSAQVGLSVQSSIVPTLRIDANDPLETIIAKLNDCQPDALVSYASMAALLAQKQMEGLLKINPKAIFTSSEVLTTEMKNAIKKAWGREPFNQYAMTESGGLGSECEMHNGMHLFNDLVITEIVDENNRPVPPGTFGSKLLVTVLFSRTQPLIRYQVSDSIKISNKKCACGRPFPLIEEIQGRSDQIIYMKSLQNEDVAVHPTIFYNIMDLVGITQWQVILNKEEFTFIIVGKQEPEIEHKINELLHQALSKINIKPPKVSICYSDLQRNSRGKLSLIINNLEYNE